MTLDLCFFFFFFLPALLPLPRLNVRAPSGAVCVPGSSAVCTSERSSIPPWHVTHISSGSLSSHRTGEMIPTPAVILRGAPLVSDSTRRLLSPCLVPHPENNFRERASLRTRRLSLSDRLQFPRERWMNGDRLCRFQHEVIFFLFCFLSVLSELSNLNDDSMMK